MAATHGGTRLAKLKLCAWCRVSLFRRTLIKVVKASPSTSSPKQLQGGAGIRGGITAQLGMKCYNVPAN